MLCFFRFSRRLQVIAASLLLVLAAVSGLMGDGDTKREPVATDTASSPRRRTPDRAIAGMDNDSAAGTRSPRHAGGGRRRPATGLDEPARHTGNASALVSQEETLPDPVAEHGQPRAAGMWQRPDTRQPGIPFSFAIPQDWLPADSPFAAAIWQARKQFADEMNSLPEEADPSTPEYAAQWRRSTATHDDYLRLRLGGPAYFLFTARAEAEKQAAKDRARQPGPGQGSDGFPQSQNQPQ